MDIRNHIPSFLQHKVFLVITPILALALFPYIQHLTPTMSAKTPVLFLSHGGPTIFEDVHHPAYQKLATIGHEITTEIKPKAIVVFSAHWQGSRPDVIEVNTATNTDLIYDFYGFPAHFYRAKFPHRGSPELANKVLDLLTKNGIRAEGVKRGLDHGVWASFMCAFDPEKNPIGDIPIVQVSLFDGEDPDQHYALGEAISSLRDAGVLVVGTGMAVHNLRDFRLACAKFGAGGGMPYAFSFDEALKDAVEVEPKDRKAAMKELLKRGDARKAHPSFEHLLPVHIAAGAAGEDKGVRFWTQVEGSVSWGMVRFG